MRVLLSMKKRALVFFLLITALVFSFPITAVHAATAKEKALQAYDDFLKKYDPQDEGANPRFDTIYVDNNSVPELIISNYEVHSSAVELYTYKNGKVKKLGRYGECGAIIYAKKRGMVKSYSAYTGCEDYDYYRMKKGKMALVKSFDGGEAATDFLVNGKKVSKREYNLALKKYDSKYKWRTVEYKDMKKLDCSFSDKR